MAAPIALITGSARRIGARIAETLHRKGCRVVIHYHRSEQEARQLVDAFNRERPASAACLAADLRDPLVQEYQYALQAEKKGRRRDLCRGRRSERSGHRFRTELDLAHNASRSQLVRCRF